MISITFWERVLKSMVAGLAIGSFLVPANGADKILFIGKQPDHPYGSHMYLHTCGVLAKCVELHGGTTTVVSDGWPSDPKQLDGVKSIVVYTSPGAEFLMDGPSEGEFDKMMKDGVGLVTIHWASTVVKQNFDRLGPRWMNYLGGTWISNVGLSTDRSNLKQLQPSHPICRGWKEYELHDEFYLNPRLTNDATPQLQVVTKGKELTVGWSYERSGGGRSYGTTLGHYYRNFQIETFRKTIVNAILWTANIEVPPNGAAVNIDEKWLKLPPNPER